MKWKEIRRRAGALLLSVAIFVGSVPMGGYAAEEQVLEELQEISDEASDEEIITIPEEGEVETPSAEIEESGEDENTSTENESGEGSEETPEPESEESEPEESEPEESEPEESEPEESEPEESEPEELEPEEAESEQPDDGQYHFQEGDAASVAVWRDQYLPNGYEDLYALDEAWWENLYDYERDLAEFLKGCIVDSSKAIYIDESLEESMQVLESGVSPEDYFAGTIYEGLSLDDLYRLENCGMSYDDLYEFWMGACAGEESDLYLQYLEEEEAPSEKLQVLAELTEKIAPVNEMLYTPANGDQVSKMSVSATGYSGTSHGTIYKLTLGEQPAMCLSMGKSARSTYLYKADTGTYEKGDDGIGFITYSYGRLGGVNYVCAQVALWLYQKSAGYSKSAVTERAAAMLNTSGMDGDDLDRYTTLVWNIYSGAQNRTHSYYIFHSDNSNSQVVSTSTLPKTYIYSDGGSSGGETGGETGGGEESREYETGSTSASVSDSVTVQAQVTVTKHDGLTNEVLAGAQIRINGKTYGTGTDGMVTHTEEETHKASAEGSTYTYVKDWDSLDAEQRADADSKGYYHSKEEAKKASREEADKKVQDELDDWKDSWKKKFTAEETASPYGYCNNPENSWEVTVKNKKSKEHDFYNKPWEAWIRVTKHDSVTGQSDASLADAEFSVYEYQKETGTYEPYHYEDRKLMTDREDGTYEVGPLYYNPSNEGRFMILETRSPYGYTIDRKTNRFFIQITGEQTIMLTEGNAYNQAGTYPAASDAPADLKAYNEPWKIKIRADKRDEDTGKKLSEVVFRILRYNRLTKDYEETTGYQPKDISVKEQVDGTYLSDWIYWNEQNRGKFYLVEKQARKGYFGAWKDRLSELITGHPAGWTDDDAQGKTVYYFEITGSRTEEGEQEEYCNLKTLTASAGEHGTIINERTKGKVTVQKYDTESESMQVQGDAALEGAVYELRVAEDIIHADGHTGVIYRKGDLVRTGIIGKNGMFSFDQIELGKYTLKEVKASEGYMLDETTYFLTFTWDDETQRVILRDETARSDRNTLTMDDADSGHEKIYTGDYVQKKAFSLIKTSDNQYQTELIPVKNAGFTVYLVSELAGVRNRHLQPENGKTWSADDIRQFYDYDFTGERAATVYKRSMETWTEGDRRWLASVSGGKANEYLVKEMFTDEKGALVSPELPFGTYVVVETTTPENHEMARPFFVWITDDGGVCYTDSTRQVMKEVFSEARDIRFGDHQNASIYKDTGVYRANAVEGRIPQETRYISNNRTETYIRLVKTDTDFMAPDGTLLTPEEMVKGTVLKEGASYRMKATLDQREYELLLKNGWKQDRDGYIWYYEPASRKKYGTVDCPFTPTLLKNAQGKIVDCYLTIPAKLPTGSYELTELTAPEGYVQNGAEQRLADTSEDRLLSYRIETAEKRSIRFVIDNATVYPDGQMGNNRYTLMDQYGNLICTVCQDNQEQKGILELIKHGEKLYGASDREGTALKEKISTSHFRRIWNAAEYEVRDQVFEYQDAPIEGAVFEVYAAEDIYTQELDRRLLEEYGVDTDAYLVWHQDEKIATLTTDRTGYAYLADLYIGSYYIREVTAGDGFVLNPEVQYFSITPQEQTVNFEWVSSDYVNARQKIRMGVEKTDVETKEPLAGAVYGLYNRANIYSYIKENPDKTVPDYRHVQTVFHYVNQDEGRLLIPANTLIATAVTDEEGRAVFTEDLPLGQYYIRELEAPTGYTTTDQMVEVDASYEGESGSQEVEIQDHTNIRYENQKTKHIFVKSDIVSGVTIPGAYLEIWEILVDEHGNLRKQADGSWMLAEKPSASWVSKAAGEELHYFYEKDGYYMELASPEELPEGETLLTKEGHLIEKLEVGKQYVLRETLAPENYVGYETSSEETKEANRELNPATEEVRFLVENDNLVAEHNLKNQRTVGSFSVTKEGEFFTGIRQNLLKMIFQYLFGRVEQAQFDVFVRDDIFTPDGTGRYAEWTNSEGGTLELKKDVKIETVKTDRTGIASVKNLPLGSYYIREVKAGDGSFLLNPEVKDVVLVYEGQEVPVVWAEDTPYINERQKVSIKLVKYSDKNLPVEGAVFGLFAEEDLYGYVISGERVVTPYEEPMIPKDQLLETVVSDSDGQVLFEADLPCGYYYVEELCPAGGYLQNPERYHFDASYTGQDGEEVLVFRQEVRNTQTSVSVSKRDLTNGEELEGSELAVIEKETGKIVDAWISDKKPHEIRGLKLTGEQEHIYLLREIRPTDGYVTAEEIPFRLIQKTDGDGEWLQEWTVQIQKTAGGITYWKDLDAHQIIMEDDITRVEIRKTESDGKTFLTGAELVLLREDGSEAVSFITHVEESFYMEKLPIGHYILKERSAPDGYEIAEPMEIVVKDTGEKQVFVLINELLPESEQEQPEEPEEEQPEESKSEQKPRTKHSDGKTEQEIPVSTPEQIESAHTGDAVFSILLLALVCASMAGFGIGVAVYDWRRRRK